MCQWAFSLLRFLVRYLSVIIHIYFCRRAVDLEPLQPLLRKYIGLLEAEEMSLSLESPRPQLDRATLWLGIKSL